jgi:hypothetical protein
MQVGIHEIDTFGGKRLSTTAGSQDKGADAIGPMSDFRARLGGFGVSSSDPGSLREVGCEA